MRRRRVDDALDDVPVERRGWTEADPWPGATPARRFTAWQEARDHWADSHPDTDLPIPPDMPWNPEDDQP